MIPLPNDIFRCLGRRDWTAETDICPKRDGCERYQAVLANDWGERTPWEMWLCKSPLFERIRPMPFDRTP
jgi:hypothetical protein